MVNVLVCSLEVSEFEPLLSYYIHFRTNTLLKGMNPLLFFYKGSFGIKLAMNVYIPLKIQKTKQCLYEIDPKLLKTL